MQELIDALKVRQKYNKMSLDKFIKKYEEFYKVKIPREVVNEFRFTGLNNIDFIGFYGNYIH